MNEILICAVLPVVGYISLIFFKLKKENSVLKKITVDQRIENEKKDVQIDIKNMSDSELDADIRKQLKSDS